MVSDSACRLPYWISAFLAGCGKLYRYARTRWSARVAQQKNISAGCSKRPFSKAAASEVARRTLRYVEPLSDARTPLADFFNILLGTCPTEPICSDYARAAISRYGVLRGRKLMICRLMKCYPFHPEGMEPVK